MVSSWCGDDHSVSFEIICSGKSKFSSLQMTGQTVNRFRSSVLFCFKCVKSMHPKTCKQNYAISLEYQVFCGRLKYNTILGDVHVRFISKWLVGISQWELRRVFKLMLQVGTLSQSDRHFLKFSQSKDEPKASIWKPASVSSMLMIRFIENLESSLFIGFRISYNSSLLNFFWFDLFRLKVVSVDLKYLFK